MLGIALQLQANGFHTIVLLAGNFLPLAERAGLAAHPLIDRETFSAILQRPEIWKPIQGARLLLGAAAQFMPDHYRWLEQNAVPGRTLLVAHPLDFASRIFRDRYPEVPLMSVHLAPGTLRTYRQRPRMTGWWFEFDRPAWLVSLAYWIVDRLVIDRILTPSTNKLRQQVGLPPVSRPLNHWWYSPDAVAGMFPEWFGPSLDCLLPQFRAFGFPLNDHPALHGATESREPSVAEPQRLEDAFVFTAGSGNVHARDFFAAATDVCREYQLPAILLCRQRDQLPADLPQGVVHIPFHPLGDLLSTARAIVHHGGIGTTAQALAHGIPQWIFPHAYDQFDNGSRIRRLGVGDWCSASRLNPRSMRKAVAALLEHTDWQTRAQALRLRIAQQPDACAAAAAWAMELAAHRGVVSTAPIAPRSPNSVS